MDSVSVRIAHRDDRCRYWAKVIRAGQALPLPSATNGANDLAGVESRKGEEELLPGDVLIEGEEAHTKAPTGIKAHLKTAGLPAELLTGSGDVAACVRIAHGLRLGMADIIVKA